MKKHYYVTQYHVNPCFTWLLRLMLHLHPTMISQMPSHQNLVVNAVYRLAINYKYLKYKYRDFPGTWKLLDGRVLDVIIKTEFLLGSYLELDVIVNISIGFNTHPNNTFYLNPSQQPANVDNVYIIKCTPINKTEKMISYKF